MWLFPIRNALTRKLPYSVLLQCSKQNKPQNLILVPKQHFGQGQKTRIFGHAKPKSASKYPDFGPIIVFVPLSLLLLFSFDYNKLKDRYGLDFGWFRTFMNRDKGTGVDFTPAKEIELQRRVDPGLEYALQENLEEMQEYMKQESLKRYKKELEALANNDPEFKAILAGDEEEIAKLEITDKETFEAKKLWAAQFKNIKAETPFAMVEDPDEDANALLESSSGSNENYGFKHRKIVDYENRLRQYSTPDKIFRYFATYQVIDKKGQLHIMMTPEDFLRSITPGIKQPEKLGLDKYVTLNNQDELLQLVTSLGMDEDSIFHQLSSGGLISFSDYIFLLTVLSTSRRHFEIAFKMFDLNGDGNVDAKEFEVVTNLMKNQSSMGARHRDHSNTGNAYKGINSGLISFFFGPNREGILTVEKFLEFQRQLQNEILRLEFTRKSSGNCTISEKEFADLLIAYAGFPAKKKAKMMKRVKKGFHNGDGIILDDFLNFYQVLYSINDIDTALTFYNIAGAPIQRSTMKHVAHTVAGVELSDHIIDVVFVLFDEDGDGKLSNKEFIQVMKQRAVRGLEKPKDTGIGKFMNAISKCAHDVKPTVLGGMRKTE